MIPRKDEIAAVVKQLEADHASADAAARAVIKEFWRVFQQRDTWAIVVPLPEMGSVIMYGPFGDRGEATRGIKLLSGIDGKYHIIRLRPVGTAEVPQGDSRYCPDCKHPKFAHGFSVRAGCVAKGCLCKIRYP